MAELGKDTEGTIRRMWAGRFGAPPTVFDTEGVTHIDWKDGAAVVVVRLGAATVVAAPTRMLPAVRGLAPDQLLDPDLLRAALEPERTSLLGEAHLAYADHRTLIPRGAGRTRAAEDDDIELVLTACTDAEREESGLAEMDARWVARSSKGKPVAAGGYEIWDEQIAHIGLVVASDHRSRGFGSLVGAVAARHALYEGLIPQWRSSVTNPASMRTGERNGFMPFGEQLSFLVGQEYV